ncbi:metalloproteinase inhibitor 3-like isoform X2 [Crassostrea virginica]
MREVVTFFVLLTSMYICTEACGCLRQHPQVQFCNADFAVKAKILNRTSTVPVDPKRLRSGYTLFFTVKIIQDYKNQTNRYTYQTQDIYTESHDSFCGENFLIGDEYIILGRIYEGQWRTIHCDGNSFPLLITKYQKEAYLLEYYKKGCLCQSLGMSFAMLFP